MQFLNLGWNPCSSKFGGNNTWRWSVNQPFISWKCPIFSSKQFFTGIGAYLSECSRELAEPPLVSSASITSEHSNRWTVLQRWLWWSVRIAIDEHSRTEFVEFVYSRRWFIWNFKWFYSGFGSGSRSTYPRRSYVSVCKKTTKFWTNLSFSSLFAFGMFFYKFYQFVLIQNILLFVILGFYKATIGGVDVFLG